MLKAIAYISLTVTGLGSVFAYSTYEATKVTMLEHLNDSVFQGKNLSHGIHIHRHLPPNSSGTDPEQLKQGCFSKYQFTYSSAFQKPKTELASKIKLYCSLNK